jgi:O-antigen ligase
MVVLAAVIASVLFGRAAIRAERQGLDDTRVCVTRSVLPAIADNWVTGVGPGAFRYYFPAYRNPECGLEGTWFRAHNFYVEAALALGLVVAVPAILFAYLVLLNCFRLGLGRRKTKRPYIWGAIAAVMIATIHAFTDFSLQIPGFAMSLALICAAGVNFSRNPRRG